MEQASPKASEDIPTGGVEAQRNSSTSTSTNSKGNVPPKSSSLRTAAASQPIILNLGTGIGEASFVQHPQQQQSDSEKRRIEQMLASELDPRYDWVGPPDRISKIRPIRLRRLSNETQSEADYRRAREALNEWNSQFWREHNQLFERRRADFVNDRKKELGVLEQVSSEDMALFYKIFLNENAAKFAAYNNEWYRRNFALFWPAFRVGWIRCKRALRLLG